MFRSCLAVLVLAACTNPVNIDPPAPPGLADRFQLVAFYDEISGDELPLQRWNSEVRVALATDAADGYRDAVQSIVDTLDRLLPVPVDLVDIDDRPTTLLLIGSWQEIDEFRTALPDHLTWTYPKRFSCHFRVHPGERSPPDVLAGGWILIYAGLDPAHIRRCLAQEITQSLGLPNDIDDPDGTVFSSYSRRETLSASDQNMVRILYDRRLTPGMTRAEAMPIVREIAAELEAQQANRTDDG